MPVPKNIIDSDETDRNGVYWSYVASGPNSLE